MSVSRSLLIWPAVSGAPEAPPADVDDAAFETDVLAADVGAPAEVPVEAAEVLFEPAPAAVVPTVPELLQAAVVMMAPVSTPTEALLIPNLLIPNPMPIPHFDEMHRAQVVMRRALTECLTITE